jgi:hypothetical protein
MFILYAIPIGLLLGLLAGGRIAGLATIRFRWAWVAAVGLAVQIVLFSPAVADRIGEAGPPIYVLSTATVLVAVLRNLDIPGIAIVAAGAAANLAAIVSNGGYMPTTADALAAAGAEPPVGYSNSAIIEDPALAPLTDLFALPPWIPFANVFSVGDVLIGVGVIVAIAVAMRRGPRDGPSAAEG